MWHFTWTRSCRPGLYVHPSVPITYCLSCDIYTNLSFKYFMTSAIPSPKKTRFLKKQTTFAIRLRGIKLFKIFVVIIHFLWIITFFNKLFWNLTKWHINAWNSDRTKYGCFSAYTIGANKCKCLLWGVVVVEATLTFWDNSHSCQNLL